MVGLSPIRMAGSSALYWSASFMVTTRLRAAVMESGEAVWAGAIEGENSNRHAIIKRRRVMWIPPLGNCASGKRARGTQACPVRSRPSAQSLIDHQAACQLQFAQRTGNEPLGGRGDIATRGHLEIAQRAVAGLEWGEDAGQAQGHVGAVAERQKQQLQMGGPLG